MKEYRLSEEGIRKQKRLWYVSMVGWYIPIIGIFAFNLLYKGGDMRDVIIFSVLIVALSVALYFGRGKFFGNIDKSFIRIDDEQIILRMPGQDEASMQLADIRKVTPRGPGVLLVNKDSKKKSITIVNHFEGYEEVKAIVEAAAAEKYEAVVR